MIINKKRPEGRGIKPLQNLRSKFCIKMIFIQSKKSQVTIFLLLMLVFAIAISLIIYQKSEISKNTGLKIEAALSKNDIFALKNIINVCLKETLDKGIEKLELAGGHLNNKTLIFFYTEPLKINYLYYNKKDYIPQIEDMEYDLGNYIKNNIRYCLKDFRSFEDKGVNILLQSINVDVDINIDEVSAKLNFPIYIKNNKITEMEDFWATVPSKLLSVYYESNNIITGTKEGEKEAALGSRQREKPFSPIISSNLIITFHNYENSLKTIWVIVDNASITNKHFVFATKVTKSTYTKDFTGGNNQTLCTAQNGIICNKNEYCNELKWIMAIDTTSCCQSSCDKIYNATSSFDDIFGEEIVIYRFSEENYAICWGIENINMTYTNGFQCPLEHPNLSIPTKIADNEYSFIADNLNGISKTYNFKLNFIKEKLEIEEIKEIFIY